MFDRMITTRNAILLPIAGTIIFLLFYIIATFYYPGGSQADSNSVGFDWLHNYWCNLLNVDSINGKYNPARPVAITAMMFLCVSLAIFWLIAPIQLMLSKVLTRTIQISGTLAMSIGFLLFTPIDHDTITNLSSLLGLISTVGTMIGLYQKKLITLFGFSVLNMLLVILNNILYYNSEMIYYLPVVQKITFASFLLWVCLVCVKVNGLTSSPR
jgi:hypothetical protein